MEKLQMLLSDTRALRGTLPRGLYMLKALEGSTSVGSTQYVCKVADIQIQI
uniref:Uncharacterized protein n=1 Tax=Arundo donax TaxID=35708 RepID=A0A0A9ALH4_ARUDO